MKKIKPILFILLLLIIYIYVASISLLPNHIILFEGENLNIPILFGINVSQNSKNKLDYGLTESIQTVTNLNETQINQVGKIDISLNLFDKVPLKQIDVDIIKKTKVIPLGNAIGLKLYTKGVMVVGMSEVEDENKKMCKPYEKTGIEEGDMIIEINNTKINNTEELIKTVNEANGNNLDIKYIREEETLQTNITPVRVSGNNYKLGLWVRDAQARCWYCQFL